MHSSLTVSANAPLSARLVGSSSAPRKRQVKQRPLTRNEVAQQLSHCCNLPRGRASTELFTSIAVDACARTQRGTEISDFIIHLFRSLDSFRDFLTEKDPITNAESMDQLLDRNLRHPKQHRQMPV